MSLQNRPRWCRINACRNLFIIDDGHINGPCGYLFQHSKLLLYLRMVLPSSRPPPPQCSASSTNRRTTKCLLHSGAVASHVGVGRVSWAAADMEPMLGYHIRSL